MQLYTVDSLEIFVRVGAMHDIRSDEVIYEHEHDSISYVNVWLQKTNSENSLFPFQLSYLLSYFFKTD